MADPSGPGSSLRPLGLGEVLDRAVNLCVKYFVPLTVIFVVYAIPLAVVQFFATQDFNHVLQSLVDAMRSGRQGDQSTALARELDSMSGVNAWAPLLILMSYFVYPLPAAALIATAAGFYLGKPVTFGEAYQAALSRWLNLIGVNVMYSFAAGFLYLAFVFLIVLLAFGIGFLYSVLPAVGIAIGVILGVLFLVLTIGFVIVATLAFEMSYFGCVLEKQNLAVAFVRGISRVFVGIGLRRSLLVGCAFAAIILGIGIVTAVGEAVIIGFFKDPVLGTVYTTVVRIATSAFTTAFITIFYFDLRVREEGLDLQLAAQASGSLPSTP